MNPWEEEYATPDGGPAPWEVEYEQPAQVQAQPNSAKEAQKPAPNRQVGYVDQALALNRKANDFAKGIVKQRLRNDANTVSGMVRGAGSIGATLLYPFDKITDMVKGDREAGVTSLITGEKPLSRNQERRQMIDEGLQTLGADPASLFYKGGKLGGEVAGTAGIGTLLGNGARVVAPGLTALQNSLRTGGMVAGNTPGIANMATRIAGGGITGGATAALVDPHDAGSGAVIGALLPPAMLAAGHVGQTIGRVVHGPKVPEVVRQAAETARQSGYVIPPTQAKPTLVNRVLEGVSGKITTAQNASARNQEVTNNLAKRAIGADSLDDVGLAQVRDKANAAYSELGKVGTFQTDQKFLGSLETAGASSAQFRKDFPQLANRGVDDLIENMKSRTEFDAQSAIEAMKRLRAESRANKLAIDNASKQELGKVQAKVAAALEDLVDRNLQRTGNQTLLHNYRTARQTLAKVYDVEKALSAGNVDATKLGKLLQKKRPLTGELRTIADFGNQFPKAAQMPQKMGSLPQTSPLDFYGAAAASGITGNPALMAGVLARPAARSLALSGPIQNRLARQQFPGLLSSPELQQLLYRSAPVATAQ